MAKKLTDEERAAAKAAKKETARIKAEEKAIEAEIKAEEDALAALRKDDADALLKPKKTVKRFSNDDIYELLTSLKADIDKETTIRIGEKPVEGVKPEGAASLVGLGANFGAVIQRYKIFAKPSKAS
jgi:hypothetical protein